ncbi:hypothetical protein [Hydrogenophaga sp. PBC]|uniref:hypothetical protein n=1 Tax=Hydrogenophaga sp. PBC TaxID=795665 RepID=UPI000A05A1CF|nr:hypothetical protein [Hydrogenophaga sp. PBC]
MKSPILFATRSALIAFPALFCACGGGSSLTPGVSADPAATPPPVAANAPALALTLQNAKTFRFTWIDMAGETEYRLLEDPDGVSGYTSLTPQPLPADTTAHEHTVFLPARVNARYILQACKGGTCLDSAPVSVAGNLAQAIGFLKSDVSTADDEFGYSVALSSDGGTLAVGAPGESSAVTGIATQEPPSANDMPNSGVVYVFVRQGQRWQQQAFVKASTPTMSDRFGESLALSVTGDALAVGAPGRDAKGVVYTFTRSDGDWSERQMLAASVSGPNERFGHSLAMSAAGHVLMVGNPRESQFHNDSGAVYVFTHDGTQWNEYVTLKANFPWPYAGFGSSVSLNAAGDLLAVGAPNSDSMELSRGSAHVFMFGGMGWQEQAELKAPHAAIDLQFGTSAALSADGGTLAVGARGDASAATGVNGDPQDNSAFNSGAVHVFRRDGVNWPHQAYLKASNPGEDDQFGRAVSLSGDGNTLVVGAPYETSRADGLNGSQASTDSSAGGAAYIFQRKSLAWRQTAYVKAPNSGGQDTFGTGLALSANGQTLAVGASGEASSASGWNGSHATDNDNAQSGAIYLY